MADVAELRMLGGTVRFSGPRAAGVLGAVLVAGLPSATAAASATPVPPTRARAWIARVIVPTTARAAIGSRRAVAGVPTVARWNGGPVALLVLESRMDAQRRRWLRVALPQRPNGADGWIPADDTRLDTTPYRIEIATATRRVRLLRSGRVVLRSRAVVGARRGRPRAGCSRSPSGSRSRTRPGSSARGRCI